MATIKKANTSSSSTSAKALNANSEANKKPTFDLEKTIKKLETKGASIMQDYRGGTKKLKNFLAEVCLTYRILQNDPKAVLALSELYRKYSISTNSGPFQPFTRLVMGLYEEATEAFINEFCLDENGNVDAINGPTVRTKLKPAHAGQRRGGLLTSVGSMMNSNTQLTCSMNTAGFMGVLLKVNAVNLLNWIRTKKRTIHLMVMTVLIPHRNRKIPPVVL